METSFQAQGLHMRFDLFGNDSANETLKIEGFKEEIPTSEELGTAKFSVSNFAEFILSICDGHQLLKKLKSFKYICTFQYLLF